jgi:hypothetical protein
LDAGDQCGGRNNVKKARNDKKWMVGGDILFWFYLQFHKLILVTLTYAREAFLARYDLPFPWCRLIFRLHS